MQILHPFRGSVQQYLEQLGDWESPRPVRCPQCEANRPLTAHGFYVRTLIHLGFDDEIRVRRYLCEACRRTVSLLPHMALPYLRSSLTVIALWLLARLLPRSAGQQTPPMPYQRGQFWLRRFLAQAPALCTALAHLATPPAAPSFAQRALHMLESVGWLPAHRFLFADLRAHLLGWPPSLAPDGRRRAFVPAAAPA
jgi:transposase-like protein